MNKNVIGVIIAIIIIVAAVAGFAVYRNNKVNIENNNVDEIISNDEKENESASNEDTDNSIQEDDNTTRSGSNILVVYYSAQNHTKTIAEKIAKNLDADTFEIVPEEVYTSDDLDWTDDNSRVSKEHNNESLRDVKLKSTKVANWEDYDTVLIGYPIWWGIAAWPVNNFVKDNDFTGKTVIPFCTSASSGLGESGKLLEDLAGSGNWQDGHRFSSSAADSDIKTFTDSLK